MYILSYSNLAHIGDVPSRTRLSGSGSLRNIGTKVYIKKRSSRPPEIGGSIYTHYLRSVRYADILGIPLSPDGYKLAPDNIKNYGTFIERYQKLRGSIDQKIQYKKTTYKLNKPKVRKRAIALCRLSESKKFLAFYSISFPSGAKDSVLYEIFNKWLTNCRTRYGLKTYLWVAERQGNGTLHFHILTNNRLDISVVNRAMANSIDTSVLQGKLTWGQSSRTLYNGVDVDSIQRPKRRQGENRDQYRRRLKEHHKRHVSERVKFAVGYLTKYITKSEAVFTHLPFHCSRDVSQLFSSMVLSTNDADNYLRLLSDDPDDYDIRRIDSRVIFIFKKSPPEIIYRRIDKVNDRLFFEYHREREKHEKRPREIDITQELFS